MLRPCSSRFALSLGILSASALPASATDGPLTASEVNELAVRVSAQESRFLSLNGRWQVLLEEETLGTGGQPIPKTPVKGEYAWTRIGNQERFSAAFSLPRDGRDPRFLDTDFYFDGAIGITHYVRSKQVLISPQNVMISIRPAPADFFLVDGKPLESHILNGARLAGRYAGQEIVLTMMLPADSGDREVELRLDPTRDDLMTSWRDLTLNKEVKIDWTVDASEGFVPARAVMSTANAQLRRRITLTTDSLTFGVADDESAVAFKFEAGMLVGDYSNAPRDGVDHEPDVYRIDEKGRKAEVVLVEATTPITTRQALAVGAGAAALTALLLFARFRFARS